MTDTPAVQTTQDPAPLLAALGDSAYRDQKMAKLFTECGWTQELIALHMGKTHGWVSRRLVFGRFLKFVTTCHEHGKVPENLTEGAFRSFWRRTKGSGKRKGKKAEAEEGERFRQVLDMLGDGVPAPKPLRKV